MKIGIYHVDAFAKTVFEGKPTAVCPLKAWIPDMLMQAIAAELGVATTAFLTKKGSDFRIRWFSPSEELALSGHATLAAVHVLYEHCKIPVAPVRLHHNSGQLIASPTSEGSISLDLPAKAPEPIQLSDDIVDAIGGEPLHALSGDQLIVVYSDATEVAILTPDICAIADLTDRVLCATAPGNGNGYDFVCRVFIPGGIDEDPATGSVYASLAPYYLQRWGSMEFKVRQLSKRGADVHIRVTGNRVHVAGHARTVMKGTMMLDR